LARFQTWIEEFDGIAAVVIERYDRSPLADHQRIHQEDFNQVLGASGDQKYQRFGGTVSLARIAKVLSELGEPGALDRLLSMTVLSVALGNLDMHAKNISLLHHRDGSITLAPAYDVVPQAHQSNDGELALAVDGQYRHKAITRAHLITEGQSWGLADAERTVDEALDTTLATVISERPHPHAHAGLTEDISRFTANLIAGRAAGDS
jgi:serine/threonine-protein kinase HipA